LDRSRVSSLTLFFLHALFSAAAHAPISTLSLHDALPISVIPVRSTPSSRPRSALTSINDTATSPAATPTAATATPARCRRRRWRSEEHTSELQSRENLVCRLLPEKKNIEPIL